MMVMMMMMISVNIFRHKHLICLSVQSLRVKQSWTMSVNHFEHTLPNVQQEQRPK